MRNIVFRTKDRRGSAQNRAVDIHNKLLELGYPTQYFAGYNDEIFTEMRQIRDSVIIYIKYPELRELAMLKQNNNQVIIDVVDAIADNNYNIHDICSISWDGIIVPTQDLALMSSHINTNIKIQYIPHHWDVRHLANIDLYDKNEFRLAYIGYSAPGGGLHYNESISELNIISDWADQTRLSPYYTCHYSVRPHDSYHFLFKPNSKLSAAAAVGSNIIHSRDTVAMGLIPHDYPYFTDSNVAAVKNTIEYAKETFNGPIWNYGLEIMKELKHRTSIDTIVSHDYINYLNLFN
jgi:hypothetical protein